MGAVAVSEHTGLVCGTHNEAGVLVCAHARLSHTEVSMQPTESLQESPQKHGLGQGRGPQ